MRVPTAGPTRSRARVRRESEIARREEAQRQQAEAISQLGLSPHFVRQPLFRLSDFHVLDTLGTGTFGRVLLARLIDRPRRLCSYFAIKVLAKDNIVRLKQVDHINNERGVLAAINHPFIVKLFLSSFFSHPFYLPTN